MKKTPKKEGGAAENSKTLKKPKLPKKQKEIQDVPGLNQVFSTPQGEKIRLADILTSSDWWELKKNNSKAIVLYHDAVKKIADHAGIDTNVDYRVLIEPSVNNNYTVAIQATVKDLERPRSTSEIGEVNRSNLGLRGRANPVNMAQKRAYDRAVFRHLGITGILGEDEIQDEEEAKNEMDHLPIEEQKQIVPLINRIVNAKSQEELHEFSEEMKEVVGDYKEGQLAVLRSLWTKQFGKLQQSF